MARCRGRCEGCGASNAARGARDLFGRWHYEFAMKRLDPATRRKLFGRARPRKVRLAVAMVSKSIGRATAEALGFGPYPKISNGQYALCQDCAAAARKKKK
jgi:hypothetical protein